MSNGELPPAFDYATQEKMLEYIRLGYTVSAAAKVLEVNMSTVAAYKLRNEEFAARMADARVNGVEAMMDEVVDIADQYGGVREKMEARKWVVDKMVQMLTARQGKEISKTKFLKLLEELDEQKHILPKAEADNEVGTIHPEHEKSMVATQ